MKEINYLSPTSIAMWNQDKEQFYLNYLSDNRPPREPQNAAMAIGSATDAFIKSYLHESLFGKNHKDSGKFRFETIFESQVEKDNRDQARRHGAYVFQEYKSSGALADLMLELIQGSEPKLEFEIRGSVSGYREGGQTEIDFDTKEVVLLGKPDITYISPGGVLVILDFKVNGFYSTYKMSPVSGYIRLRGANKTNHGMHKDAFAIDDRGIKINCASTLDMVKPEWAQQLAIYAWISGGVVGGDYITAIDQIVCNPVPGALPSIKVAEHRCKINPEWQKNLFNNICEIWQIVRSDWIFRDIEKADSQERCRLLDGVSAGVIETDADKWFEDVTKKKRY